MLKTVLSISVFDSSGASGLIADLKTFQTFRVYGAGVVTGIAAQCTTDLRALYPVSMELVGEQMETVCGDMKVYGVKVGSLVTDANVRIVGSLLKELELGKFMVMDPGLFTWTGKPLLEPSAMQHYKEDILSQAGVLVLNPEEATLLSDVEVKDVNSAKEASKVLNSLGCREVVMTSVGFDAPRALDLWFDGSHFHLFDAPSIPTNNTLGIGSTFSSIITALLVKGSSVGESIDKAKKYIAKAVKHPFVLGKGKGPLNHTIPI